MTTTISALSLPFDEAIAYLAQKTNATSEHWTDVWQKANAKAFTVAGAATKALVEDFRAEVAKALEKGTTLAEFRKSFDAIVKKHGWQHTGTPGWRASIIYQTNLAMAYSAGRYAQATEPETLAQYPYWQYVHSGALHPRLNHLAWNGLVLRADDPWWSSHYPPCGWRCGCRVRVLSARDLGRQGKRGPDQAPPVEYVPWKNPKTGEVKQVVKGIDPGFDYNPGAVWKATPVSIPPNATLQVPAIPGLPRIGKPKLPSLPGTGKQELKPLAPAKPPQPPQSKAPPKLKSGAREDRPPVPKAPTPLDPGALRKRIRQSYLALTGGQLNARIWLSDLRAALPDIDRATLDAALRRMHLEEGTTLSGMNNPQELTPATRAGAVDFKGQPMYVLWITK